MRGIIDIRSDTVTGPTAAMRKAMADADVGDDVYGDDPTVNKLEKTGAELLGKEAAVFVPSGTFGNQLALFTHCPRGTEVLLGEECHIIQHEAGATSVIAGVQTRPISAPDGVLTAAALRRRLRARDLHAPATSLICLENAHSSGKAVPLAVMDEARAVAGEWKLPIHLDGARIFNAVAELNCTAADIAARCDSVMFCLSKGLCAPVGSLLAGSRDFVEEARYKRKIMGGGMRQAGILAAAGLTALAEHPPLLPEDHRRARTLENALAEIPGLTVERGNINMVFFSIRVPKHTSADVKIVELFRERGIVIGAPAREAPDDKPALHGKASLPDEAAAQGGITSQSKAAAQDEVNLVFRFVTHYWIGDKELTLIIDAAHAVFGSAKWTGQS